LARREEPDYSDAEDLASHLSSLAKLHYLIMTGPNLNFHSGFWEIIAGKL